MNPEVVSLTDKSTWVQSQAGSTKPKRLVPDNLINKPCPDYYIQEMESGIISTQIQLSFG